MATKAAKTTCPLCERPLHREFSVVHRRAEHVSVFACTRCGADGWHVDCALAQFAPSDREVGFACRQCRHVSAVRREPGLLMRMLRILWAPYPRAPALAPWGVSFLFGRLVDVIALIAGSLVMALAHAIRAHPDPSAPGAAEHIVGTEMLRELERQHAHIVDVADPSRAAGMLVAIWLTGAMAVSLATSALGCCVRDRRQRARGFVVD